MLSTSPSRILNRRLQNWHMQAAALWNPATKQCSNEDNSFYSGVDIAEVDLNKCEPWELPDGGENEELLSFYLALKVFHGSFYSGVDIAEVDLNKCEPWELPVYTCSCSIQ